MSRLKAARPHTLLSSLGYLSARLHPSNPELT